MLVVWLPQNRTWWWVAEVYLRFIGVASDSNPCIVRRNNEGNLSARNEAVRSQAEIEPPQLPSEEGMFRLVGMHLTDARRRTGLEVGHYYHLEAGSLEDQQNYLVYEGEDLI